MSLDIQEIKKIAHLARLDITDKSEDDLSNIVSDLNKIFDWVDQIQEADDSVKNISPMAHPLNTMQRTREDIITETDQHQELQKIAPSTEAGLYLVPTVIE